MTINPRTLQAYQLLHHGVLALARAERAGIRVDVHYIEAKKKQLTGKIARLEEEFKCTKLYHHWAHTTKGEPNINSNQQLAHFLYGVKKLKPVNTTTSGQGAVDEDSLRQLNLPEIETLLQMRKLKKVRDTYLDAFLREQVGGYMHPSFNLHLVVTFRSSSDHPNFQNIPRRDEESMQACRRAVFPRPGHQLLEIDFSGLEVRIAACYHRDPTMLKYISNPVSDMHRDMAEQIFMLKIDKSIPSHKTLRDAAKNGFVFPEFYGDYYGNCAVGMACEWGKLPQGQWKPGQGLSLPEGYLSDHLISKGIKSLGAFTKHLKEIEEDFWNNRFPAYRDWKERHWNVYNKYGYFDLLTGFRCSGVMSRNDAINYPVQGAAFHCLLWSFLEIDRVMQKEQWDTRLVGQIHDSVILDVHPDELDHVGKVVKQITTVDLPKAWSWIAVPLDVDADVCPVDRPWSEKQKYEL